MAKKQDIHDFLTPIFDWYSGPRLKLVRMKMNWDQAQLGTLLGISQQQVSKLERGQLRTADFTFAKFIEIFDKHVHFILLGTGADRYSHYTIHTRYWESRLGPKGSKQKREKEALLGGKTDKSSQSV